MFNSKIVAVASLGIGMFSAPQAFQAQPVIDNHKFDVASVRPNRDAAGASIVRTPEGLTAHNVEFHRLIEMAFQTRLTDLSQAPESLRSERFDIVAKAERKISGDEYWDMLRSLLEDRFMLQFHYEAQNVQFYALVLAKRGTNLGSKIRRSQDADCPVNPNGSNYCGIRSKPGLMVGQRVTLSRIGNELSAFAGRPVQDQTNLTGSFNFELTWTPDEYISSNGQAKLLKRQSNRYIFSVFFLRYSRAAWAKVGVQKRAGRDPRHRPRRNSVRRLSRDSDARRSGSAHLQFHPGIL